MYYSNVFWPSVLLETESPLAYRGSFLVSTSEKPLALLSGSSVYMHMPVNLILSIPW